MADKSIYAVMRRSGRMMQFRDALSGNSTESGGPYLHILGVVVTEFQSAGSDWDAPDKLFLNGNLVVAKGLSDLAWKFHQDKIGARDAAYNTVKNIHMPDWLPDSEVKPGFNPSGTDAWTVEKRK